MPAVIVKDWVSTNTGITTPASTTVNLLGGGTAAAGNTLLAAANCDATVGTPAGWSLLASSINNAGCYLFGKVAAGGETGITVTPSGAASMSLGIAEIGNLVGALITNRVDVTATGGSSSGTNTRSTGTTATTAQADEYALAIWGYSANINIGGDFAAGGDNKWISQTNSFVEKLDVGTTKTTGTNVGLCIAVKDLAATGTQESTGTLLNSNSVPAQSIIATFKAAATPSNWTYGYDVIIGV